MQQEDDLRGLAKVMEFMRAISIVFVVIHVYWFCYRAFVDAGINIGVVDKILLNFQRTAGLFSNLLVTKVFAVIFLALSCLGTKGVKNQKMTWRKIYTAFLSGLVLFFMNWWMLDLPFSRRHLHGNADRRVHPSFDVGRMDKPYAETQPDGGRVQYRQREFHAGDTLDGKRVFCKFADQVRVPGQGMGRMDQRCKRFSCVHRARNARQREVLRGGEQLHKTADREILRDVYL